MKHKHKLVNKVWSQEARTWLVGNYCDICGKELKDPYHKVVKGRTVAVNLPKTGHGGWPIDPKREELNKANKALSEAFWGK